MEAQLDQHPGFSVLRVKGDLRLWGRAETEGKLRETIRAALDATLAQLVLNLDELTLIDTTGIASLVRLINECSRRNINLKVVLPSGMTGEAIRVVHIFDRCLQFHDEPAAIQAAEAQGNLA